MARVFASLAGLLVAAACLAATRPADRGAAFGAVFPGAAVSSTQSAAGCGERYAFSARAALPQVAQFYLLEGEQAGLTKIADTDAGDPTYRMINFIRPHHHQLLFVVLSGTSSATRGTVFYSPANTRPCT